MRLLLRKVHMETFVLDLEQSLAQIPADLDVNTRLVDEYTLEVELLDGQNINDLYRRLSDRHIHVRSMRNKTNRLEQLFMRLVGNKKGDQKIS